MLKLIAFLWAGCWHKWETAAHCRLTDDLGQSGQRFILRCERCGALKKFDAL